MILMQTYAVASMYYFSILMLPQMSSYKKLSENLNESTVIIITFIAAINIQLLTQSI